MTITLIDGVLKVDGKEVVMLIFKDHKTMNFPIDSTDTVIVEQGSSTAIGKNNTAITGKNIVTGNISCKGDFRLGDG